MDPAYRNQGYGLDLLESAARCLAGAMKRLTLLMCAVVPVSPEPCAGKLKLQRHFESAGFQRAVRSEDFWLLEPSGFRRRKLKIPQVLPQSLVDQSRPAMAKRRPKGCAGDPKATPIPSSQQLAADASGAAAASGVAALSDLSRADFADGLGQELTPRVYYALLAAAEAAALKLRQDADRFVNGVRGGRFWGSNFLPPALKDNVFKSFVIGMASIVDYIGAMLISRRIPSVGNVTESLAILGGAPVDLGVRLERHLVSHFFGHGGRIEHVLQALVDKAAALYEELEDAEIEDAAHLSDDALEGGGRARRPLHIYRSLPANFSDLDFEHVRGILVPQEPEDS